MSTLASVDGIIAEAREWLATEPADEVGWFQLRSGRRLLIASLTEAEVLGARKRSSRDDQPVNPSRLRRELVAASVNKAFRSGPTDPSYLDPQLLVDRPVGELASLLGAVIRLSGLVAEADLRFVADLLP